MTGNIKGWIFVINKHVFFSHGGLAQLVHFQEGKEVKGKRVQ